MMIRGTVSAECVEVTRNEIIIVITQYGDTSSRHTCGDQVRIVMGAGGGARAEGKGDVTFACIVIARIA